MYVCRVCQVESLISVDVYVVAAEWKAFVKKYALHSKIFLKDFLSFSEQADFKISSGLQP